MWVLRKIPLASLLMLVQRLGTCFYKNTFIRLGLKAYFKARTTLLVSPWWCVQARTPVLLRYLVSPRQVRVVVSRKGWKALELTPSPTPRTYRMKAVPAVSTFMCYFGTPRSPSTEPNLT